MESKTVSTYYQDMLPELIEKYEILVKQCFSIMTAEIDADLTGDKRFNELKSKRQASEDAKYYAKEIDNLKNEMNGVTPEDAPTVEPVSKNWAKRQAMKAP
jgi:4-diphosphocytidyl-2C-methyl-D-erythritol kinase